MKRQDSSIPQMQDLLCILVLQQCHCHHRTLAHTYAWSRPCLGHNQSFCLQQLHHQFSEWHHSPTKSLFHRHNENSQLELPDGKFIYVTFHKTCISFKVQTLTSYSLDQSTPQNKVLKCCSLDRRPLMAPGIYDNNNNHGFMAIIQVNLY